jgi:hypothetical protein
MKIACPNQLSSPALIMGLKDGLGRVTSPSVQEGRTLRLLHVEARSVESYATVFKITRQYKLSAI